MKHGKSQGAGSVWELNRVGREQSGCMESDQWSAQAGRGGKTQGACSAQALSIVGREQSGCREYPGTQQGGEGSYFLV